MNKTCKIFMTVAVLCIGTAAFARPHHHRHHKHNDGLALANGIVDLVLKVVAPRPAPVVVAPQPAPVVIAPQPAPVVVAPPPVIVTPPPRRPVIVTPPPRYHYAPPRHHHAPPRRPGHRR